MERLWIARHGESAGNVALRLAESSGATRIDVAERDADVPLSPRGEEQARALGAWLGRLPFEARPSIAITSPYRRAIDTTTLALTAAGMPDVRVLIDERLREKEFGALNRLTKAGIAATYPDQARLRQTLGKFYYRPPGGESWCDIVLRLRSFVADLRADFGGHRVLVVCHSAVTFCFRYLLEGLSEQQVLAIDAETDVANCAVTSYAVDAAAPAHRRFRLEAWNVVAPLAEAQAPITTAPDAARPK
jgi:broad specificity phosphatase PhoE